VKKQSGGWLYPYFCFVLIIKLFRVYNMIYVDARLLNGICFVESFLDYEVWYFTPKTPYSRSLFRHTKYLELICVFSNTRNKYLHTHVLSITIVM